MQNYQERRKVPLIKRLSAATFMLLLLGISAEANLHALRSQQKIDLLQRRFDTVLKDLTSLRNSVENGQSITAADIQAVIDNALSTRIVNTPGPAGPQGPQGPRGPQGLPGSTSSSTSTTTTRPSTTTTTFCLLKANGRCIP